jgi:hypothetical protein
VSANNPDRSRRKTEPEGNTQDEERGYDLAQ